MKNFFKKMGGNGIFLLIFQFIGVYILGSLINYNLINGFDVAGIFGYVIILGFLAVSTVWQYKNYIGFSKFGDGLFGKKLK